MEGERRIAKRSEVRTTVAIEAIKLTNCGVMVVQETVAHELQGNSCWCVCVSVRACPYECVYRYACVCVCVLVCVHAKFAERTKHKPDDWGWLGGRKTKRKRN